MEKSPTLMCSVVDMTMIELGAMLGEVGENLKKQRCSTSFPELGCHMVYYHLNP